MKKSILSLEQSLDFTKYMPRWVCAVRWVGETCSSVSSNCPGHWEGVEALWEAIILLAGIVMQMQSEPAQCCP